MHTDETISAPQTSFAELGLIGPVLEAISAVGYETPSPIQAATIPHLLAGRDILGQAQTGTGKTAAFALPILSRIDVAQRRTQALVLAPTRELAIQVAEAFQRYAAHLPDFHVAPIYGGQSYAPQLQSLRRGAHVIVATPGRVMDHMKRGSLSLEALRYLVLDEADEMLQMGFIDDVEWVLEQAPATRTIALFSATLPPAIRRIAQKHLKTPAEVTIKSKTTTAANIRQRYWMVSGLHKLDALTRILEAEAFEGMLVFTRTKQSTVELAERLEARGFAAEALNGDMQQAHRERTIARLRAGQTDIVVATDVAARGLDVERVGHVINFDAPYDVESYVHRIGRTGRAGRSGEAILFLAPRERHLLRAIEKATRQSIELMQLPTIADVNERRVARFMERITDALGAEDWSSYQPLVEQYEREHNVPAVEIAAALARMAQGGKPLLLPDREPRGAEPARNAALDAPRSKATAPADKPKLDKATLDRPTSDKRTRTDSPQRSTSRDAQESRPARGERERERSHDDAEMETYRIEVGRVHGVKPANIMGAIANEAGLDGAHVGRIEIMDDHSFVDLPQGMPKEIFRHLQKVRVAGQALQIGRARKPLRTESRSARASQPHAPRRDHKIRSKAKRG